MTHATASSRELSVAAIALAVAGATGVLAANQGLSAIALPLVVVGGVVLFLRPVLGLFLLAGTIPIEAGLMVQGRSVAALIGMGAFSVWAAQKLLRREPLLSLVSPGLMQIAYVFFAFACLSLIWAEYPQGMERRLILLFQLLLLCMLVSDLASSWGRITWVAKLFVLAGTVAAALTVEQYFFGGARRAGEGVVGGINRTAVTLVTILPFAFYLLRSSEPRPWRLLGLGYVGLSGIAVAATMSRMNFLLFPLVILVHLAVMARTRAGRQRVLLLAGATVLAVAFLPMDAVQQRAATITPYVSQSMVAEEAAETQTARGYHMRMSVAIFRDHPIIGAGYQNYNPSFLAYQWRVPGSPRLRTTPQSPHNSHVAFLANLGIVGFILWMGIFLAAGTYLWRTWRAVRGRGDGNPTLFVEAMFIVVGLLFVYGFYAEIHQDKIFWFAIGLTVAAYVLGRGGLPTAAGRRPIRNPSSVALDHNPE